jgi:hypothetical protein
VTCILKTQPCIQKQVTKTILLELEEIEFKTFADYYETQQAGLAERLLLSSQPN